MKPDYKNWMPKGMVLTGAGATALFFALFVVFGLTGLDQTAENCDNGLLRIYNVDLPDVIAVRNELLPEGGRVENIISGGKRFDECAKWHI